MEYTENSLIKYFNYDLEKLLNEFNNYYVLKSGKLPSYIQALFLYFSHLAENSLHVLIDNNYNIRYAKEIEYVPKIDRKVFTAEEMTAIIRNKPLNPVIFYALTGFSLNFFEKFLLYIKYGDEKGIHLLLKNLPVIEDNLHLIRGLL